MEKIPPRGKQTCILPFANQAIERAMERESSNHTFSIFLRNKCIAYYFLV